MTINRTEDIRSVRQAFIAPHPLFYCSLIVMKKLSSEAISNAMYKALYHMAHVTRVIKVDYILEYSFLAFPCVITLQPKARGEKIGYVVFLETQRKMKPVPGQA